MSSVQDQISLTYNETSDKKLLVFFITGNPGLIGYYQTFLTLCYDSLRSKYNDHSIHIYGSSLAGFEVEAATLRRPGPRDLEQQIQHIDQSLSSKADSSTRVVLIGHSVGSYILLEVLRRQKARHDTPRGRFIAGICLFPTVTHIAKSQSGRRFSVCAIRTRLCRYIANLTFLPRFQLISSIPCFALVAGAVVTALFSWVSLAALRKLVGVITGFPHEAAGVTAAFIRSPGGVRQALFLAKHEMQTITADKWDDELWGVADADGGGGGGGGGEALREQTKLFFYFGTNDHWVADETRDELIAARAASGKDGEERRPVMEIDESGIPHGFCISEFEPRMMDCSRFTDSSPRAQRTGCEESVGVH